MCKIHFSETLVPKILPSSFSEYTTLYSKFMLTFRLCSWRWREQLKIVRAAEDCESSWRWWEQLKIVRTAEDCESSWRWWEQLKMTRTAEDCESSWRLWERLKIVRAAEDCESSWRWWEQLQMVRAAADCESSWRWWELKNSGFTNNIKIWSDHNVLQILSTPVDDTIDRIYRIFYIHINWKKIWKSTMMGQVELVH